MINMGKKFGFTLTEILLAIVIVGVIAALVLPSVITKYHNSSFEKLAQRMVSSIQESIDSLPVTENKDFFETMMYAESETGINYENTSGAFLKKYMRLSRYCGTSEAGKKECFAANYYKYEDGDKKTYTPEYKGACASLKNGASICFTPQIGSSTCPTALVDLNGKKGPNVLGIDLREFELSCHTRTAFDRTSHDVNIDESNIGTDDEGDQQPQQPPQNACTSDNDASPGCCQWRLEDNQDYNKACCKQDSYFQKYGNKCCNEKVIMQFDDQPVIAQYNSAIQMCYYHAKMDTSKLRQKCVNSVCKDNYQALAKETCTDKFYTIPTPSQLIEITMITHGKAWAEGDSAPSGSGLEAGPFTGSYVDSGSHQRGYIYDSGIERAVCIFSKDRI